jgi:hypothetical protein
MGSERDGGCMALTLYEVALLLANAFTQLILME